jgi:hypothetical protein
MIRRIEGCKRGSVKLRWSKFVCTAVQVQQQCVLDADLIA